MCTCKCKEDKSKHPTPCNDQEIITEDGTLAEFGIEPEHIKVKK